jgi:hypothetical protein
MSCPTCGNESAPILNIRTEVVFCEKCAPPTFTGLIITREDASALRKMGVDPQTDAIEAFLTRKTAELGGL